MDERSQVMSAEELVRYRRQLIIDGFDEAAQLRLRSSTIAVLGVGGLGCPAALYLAAAGVGHLVLIDDQVPEAANLNRQILHWGTDVRASRTKVQSASWKLRELNENVHVDARFGHLSKDNISLLLGGSDLVLDCTDNFESRLVLNDFCVGHRIPLVHAGVEGLSGQVTTIVPGRTPCLRCIFPRPPRAGRELPILGAAAGVFGSLQAAEAIKTVTGLGEPLLGRMMVGDLGSGRWEEVEIARDPDCQACSRL
ncbi:MAG: HesA/MoeB/ThiF family protein [Methanomassiliicoccales archaeon]|nr:HesA/MoeB/ThiF family protein [Methanomassiliicoccales archaeon]